MVVTTRGDSTGKTGERDGVEIGSDCGAGDDNSDEFWFYLVTSPCATLTVGSEVLSYIKCQQPTREKKFDGSQLVASNHVTRTNQMWTAHVTPEVRMRVGLGREVGYSIRTRWSESKTFFP